MSVTYSTMLTKFSHPTEQVLEFIDRLSTRYQKCVYNLESALHLLLSATRNTCATNHHSFGHPHPHSLTFPKLSSTLEMKSQIQSARLTISNTRLSYLWTPTQISNFLTGMNHTMPTNHPLALMRMNGHIFGIVINTESIDFWYTDRTFGVATRPLGFKSTNLWAFDGACWSIVARHLTKFHISLEGWFCCSRTATTRIIATSSTTAHTGMKPMHISRSYASTNTVDSVQVGPNIPLSSWLFRSIAAKSGCIQMHS